MPLLKKKSLDTASSAEHFKDDDEVFYCEITSEIFRTYDEFAERMLLCTSMVWTCEMTGKTNLTYEEALESEEAARKSIKEFPEELKVPLVYVATKSQRTTFGDLSDDVFSYCKDRYFIGEKVEACFTANKWVESHVLQVIPPSQREIQKILSENKSPGQHSHPPPDLYKYEIEHLDADDQDISEIMIVDFNQIRRKKSTFTRDKCKLFLKQYVEQNDENHMVVKRSIIQQLNIENVKFDQIFAGPPPDFDPSKKNKKKQSPPSDKTAKNGKKTRQETLAKYLTKMNNNGQNSHVNNGNNGEKPKKNNNNDLVERMEKKKKEFEEMKRKHEEEKIELKKKEKEENTVIANHLKEWWKPKEDLELENQQILPELPDVITRIPKQYLGDVFTVMEFIKTFEKQLDLPNFFQSGVTLKVMERALLEQEVAGPFIDLIQMFLTTLFREQTEENAEYSMSLANATLLHKVDLNKKMTLEEAARFATLAAKWPKDRQGTSLRNLPLYHLTVSEVLRLHLLSSGAKLRESGERGRFTQRGGYSFLDDPGLHLRVYKPHILKQLAVKNVVQLNIDDKLTVLSTLVNQLLTYADIRDAIEDRIEKTLQLKIDIKNAQITERKKKSEYNAAVYNLKREAKKSKQDPSVTEKELENLQRAEEKRKAQTEKQMENNLKSVYDSEIILGMDRAFRKYYKLESIPAILVDGYEENPGICGAEVKQYAELSKIEDDKKIVEHLRKILFNKSPSSKKNNEKLNEGPTINNEVETVKEEVFSHSQLLMCSGNKQNCTVHGELRNTNWKLFSEVEQLEKVIKSLNRRGVRENELLQMIQNDKETLIKLIKQTPVEQLNSRLENCEEFRARSVHTRARKRNADANLGFPDGTTVERILEVTLIDDILDMEEKIYSGGLGQLHVKDRKAWRNTLLDRNYENFDREIVRRKFDECRDESDKDEEVEEEEEVSPHEKKKYSDFDPGTYIGTNEVILIENLTKDAQMAVECLATALVQLAYAVEPKFLQKPLGDSNPRELATYVPTKNRLENWEKSLLSCTSFSQIFLHLSTLDSCVMWSRSTLLAKCRICNRTKDSESMLLCDSCNLGHHLYCLKPKLRCVPKGDWFCVKCTTAKEQEKRKSRSSEVMPQKKRRLFKEEEEEEHVQVKHEENGHAEVKSEEVQENGDEVDDEEEEEDGEEDFDDMNDEDFSGKLCGACNSGGFLITCEECRSSYHRECADPTPKSSRSVLLWVCSDCNPDDEYQAGGRNHNNHNRNGRNRRQKRRSGRNVQVNGNAKMDLDDHQTTDSLDSDDYPLSHHLVESSNNGRRSAAKARHNIFNFIKSLRRLSSSDNGDDDDDSEGDEDSDEVQNSSDRTSSSRKRSLRLESGRDDLPLHNAALQDLLSDIMKNPNAWPFLKPVQKNEVPDYYEVISHPMDLGTIKYKLNMGEYSMDSQLMCDVSLVFQNCKTYNNADSEVYKCGDRLFQTFKEKCVELGLKVPRSNWESIDDEESRKKKRLK